MQQGRGIWGSAEKFIGWLRSCATAVETWHALNSTFPDTNCIVSFQINPHWISNSGLWKVILEIFCERLGKLTKGVLFHQDNAPAHKSMVAMAAVCDCGFWTGWLPSILIWHHLFSAPQHEKKRKKKTWLGSSIGPIMSYLQLSTFSRIRMRTIPRKSKPCNSDGRSVWTCMLKYKPHFVKFNHCIILSLWTFQPTLTVTSRERILTFTGALAELQSWSNVQTCWGCCVRDQQ